MKTLLTTATAFLILGMAVSAQTRKIAFESHGGNAENFSMDIFDEESDFGLPANKTGYSIDTVIRTTDAKIIYVKKVYNKPWGDTTNNWKYVGAQRDTILSDSGTGAIKKENAD